jgi:rhamnogalacturonyl hydrolase YesR
MFAFAFVTDVKRGWLDAAAFGPSARKAWLALVGQIDENGDLRNVCVGTGTKNDLQYYLDRPRATGDLHGQAPLLWCASAWLEEQAKE